MKPVKPFTITHYEYKKLQEQKLTCEVESLTPPMWQGEPKLWRVVQWHDYNGEKNWVKLATEYPGRTIVLVRASLRING